ncbi:MAG: asparagine synthase (glutamine-hydrolyzing) [Magnetococcales bacterium]|nr:asparagine synthase (glutamine-hydrolyzing) [Magnetococcales bacterium]
MCGIVGYQYVGEQPELDLAAALTTLSHRGPDAHGLWHGPGVGLGHTRLSVIDLATGQQPMASPDDRYHLTFNGEIYNFQTLKKTLEAWGESFATHSDTEVLLRAFVCYGLEGALAQLRGMFAFAVWDSWEQTLYLARDRLGVKPLVYHASHGQFLFASEIQALFALQPGLSRRIDPEGLMHYLSLRYLPSPWSGFAEIRKLPPAHAMVVRAGKIERLFRYWRIDPEKRLNLSFQEAVEGVREKVLEATRLRMVADVPLGAFLSGGVDSSITVAAMARLSDRAVKTFSIGFAHQAFNELPYAREVARHLQTDHHEEILGPNVSELLPRLVRHYGEPIGDDSILPTFMVSQMARRHVTVSLTGDGADELFAGYRHYHHLDFMGRLEQSGLLPVWLPFWRLVRRTLLGVGNLTRPPDRQRRFPANPRDQMLVMKMSHLERLRHLTTTFQADERRALFPGEGVPVALPDQFLADRFQECAGGPLLNHLLRMESFTYLGENLLVKVDIASMMNSLECRSPFLDHELVEFVSALPGQYKLKFPRQHKHVLKKAFASWLPPGFFQRKKQGFSAPVAHWMQHDLAEPLQDCLLGDKRLAPFLNQGEVEAYVRGHLSGERPNGRRVWALFVLAQWVQEMGVVL